jgi:hypothetical protein
MSSNWSGWNKSSEVGGDKGRVGVDGKWKALSTLIEHWTLGGGTLRRKRLISSSVNQEVWISLGSDSPTTETSDWDTARGPGRISSTLCSSQVRLSGSKER